LPDSSKSTRSLSPLAYPEGDMLMATELAAALFSYLLFLVLPVEERDFLKSGDFMAEELRLCCDIGTSILFLMTKHTPKIEFSKLKKPINIDSAINSMIPGRTASQMESLKFL